MQTISRDTAERMTVVYMPAELASEAEEVVKDFFHELHDTMPLSITDIAKEMGSVNVSHIIETLKLNLEHTSDMMKTLEENKVTLKEKIAMLKDEKVILKEENARLSQRLNLISERHDEDQHKHAEELREIRTKLDLANVQIMKLCMTAPMRKRLRLD
ncbi:hypothetical protein SARC_06544 [Sphaeroforma arctica JP610]|uniref:Uncharacterized protein n=1 Tax=Sphaeroforma arctica JP610 TaxID=667725 RepID=A0A0L0FWW9_9EUKA|nr:hypothetical protein SARC_06544 [Sphaeroforma arctica JP610]KNC81119.1 hypothetical protein SARC_06544 [Sphaeroforma arctica JP610]|eukprot:XP_014155021.1 hypothetical protein SARC_06544 [Sphaeroforma arctica JP610]